MNLRRTEPAHAFDQRIELHERVFAAVGQFEADEKPFHNAQCDEGRAKSKATLRNAEARPTLD
jgi:hypothetical protein